jgi:hypothetical protein
MNAYNTLLNSGYDGKFSTYANAIVKGAPKQIDDFMRNNGNKYFTYIVSEMQLCELEPSLKTIVQSLIKRAIANLVSHRL